MGFLDFFKNRKGKRDRVIQPDTKAQSDSVLYDRQARTSFIEGNCEIIVQAEKHIVDSRKEYEVVTSYLADIQKIDLIPEKTRKEINESAERIINLDRERQTMQRTSQKITMTQRLAIEEEAHHIDAEIQKIAENETYKKAVETDLNSLERERDRLDRAINSCIDKSVFNRRLLMFATGFITIALITLIYLQINTGRDITLVFGLIVIFGAMCAAYFLLVHRKNVMEQKENEAKLGRAILLLNKVKIKYVNVVNMLDYNYEKYHIESAEDLKYNVKEYNRILEEERKFRKAEELISFYSEDLKKRLKANGVIDAGIWVYQCEALIDPREMVEVRHHLNVRRQKLRKTIDYNTEQKKSAILSLRSLVIKNRDYETEVKMIMDRYGLTE